jgi:5-methylcytosine-specific restriction endonuclease McrA
MTTWKQCRGCRDLITTTGPARCPDCRREKEALRPLPAARGYGYAWQKLRAQVLKEEPNCAMCGAPANNVDHRVPKSSGGGDDRDNLRALCGPCHHSKSAGEAFHGR